MRVTHNDAGRPITRMGAIKCSRKPSAAQPRKIKGGQAITPG